MLDDVSISALHSALNGLSARERAISDNVANVNTPYFRARTVAFEADLKRALDSGDDPMGVRETVSYSTDAPGLTMNNVDLEAQTVDGVETQLKYELALRATGDRFSILRTAARGV